MESNAPNTGNPDNTPLYLSLATIVILLSACSSAPTRQSTSPIPDNGNISSYDIQDRIGLVDDLISAEGRASAAGRKILTTGREMTLVRQEIVRGSCWDYSNAVYDRSGYPNNKTSRKVVFKGTKEKGPYADAVLIEPGDWLFYINHSYNDIEHSAIFVKWLDPDTRTALMLSYGGEKRNAPARYLPYDVSHVYQIMRPSDKEDHLTAADAAAY